MNPAGMKLLSEVRALAIDLDGTMVDTAPDFQVALNHMLHALELAPASLQEVINSVGKGTDHLIRSILALRLQGEAVEQQFEQGRSLYMAHYLRINGEHSKLYPEVAEGLEAMKALGLRLACVTNKPYAFARGLLEKTGLAQWFEVVYGGDSLARKKPDPMQFLQVASDFAITPAQLLAIGDSSNDAQAARAAGCKVLVVPYGYNHGLPVQTIEADGIVATLNEAARLLAAVRSQAPRTGT